MSSRTLFLFHGLAGDSRYLCVLASAIAEAGFANVITPDLRGHGVGDGRGPGVGEAHERGKADFAGMSANQLIQDFEELFVQIRSRYPGEEILLGGHSLGASFAIKLAANLQMIAKVSVLLWAPFLGQTSKTINQEALKYWVEQTEGGEYQVHFPEHLRTGSEVLHYHPDFLKACVATESEQIKVQQIGLIKLCFLGAQDPLFKMDQMKQIFVGSEVIKANHFSLVTESESIALQLRKLEEVF